MAMCIERKRYLSGDEVRFACQLVALEPDLGILKYVLDRTWQVQSLTLRPGHVTYGFYWPDRPYNLYWWMDERGETLGHYFNLCDSVHLSPHEFTWRDLVIDVLVLPGGDVILIDEDELPQELTPELRAAITAARRTLLQTWPAVVREAAALLDRYTTDRA